MQLLEQVRPEMSRLARSRCELLGLPKHYADDIVSWVSHKVVRSCNRYDHKKNIISWFITSIKHSTVDVVRKKSNRASHAALLSDDVSKKDDRHSNCPWLARTIHNPLNQAIANEERERLALALDLLSERQRLAIELRFDGMTFKRIGDILNYNSTGAFVDVQNAIQKLRDILN
jgi:RNA polymerase sigma factor (sigma-70 family)